MQHISQALPEQPHELRQSGRQSETYSPERLSRARQAVAEIFSTLKTAMPARFSTMYPTPADIAAAANIWAIGIIEAKLTPKQISYGISKAISGGKYCPDLPDFISLCKPSPTDLGLPSASQAYIEACRNSHPASSGEWSHPAVYHAATQVGMFELRSLEERVTRPMFDDAYQRTVNAVLHGEELPEIPKAIEDQTGNALTPEEREASKERGIAALASMKAMFD